MTDLKPIRAQSPEVVRINQDLWGIASHTPTWMEQAHLELGERVTIEMAWGELEELFSHER